MGAQQSGVARASSRAHGRAGHESEGAIQRELASRNQDVQVLATQKRELETALADRERELEQLRRARQ